MSDLAIVIPAYKATYLRDTLKSLVSQTDKRFKVYIGDDASPQNLRQIVEEFKQSLNIEYTYFQENFGGTSLVKQWERCIQMSAEPWIWLFSDDDIADERCVEVFYQSVTENSRLYKFKTAIINKHNQRIFERFDALSWSYKLIKPSDFLRHRLEGKGFRSFAVEYVFHRSLFNEHRFVEFPLAWASDDATWLTYALSNNGITVLEGLVFWRLSDINLTSITVDVKVIDKKIDASQRFIMWLKTKNEKGLKLNDRLLLRWFTNQLLVLSSRLKYSEYKQYVYNMNLNVSQGRLLGSYIFLKTRQMKHHLSQWLHK